jgi:hypothetical protein
MSTTDTQSPSRGGEGLLALMAFAVLLGSAAIAALGVAGSWWLLPVAILAVILPAIAVAATLGRLMSDGGTPEAEYAPLPPTEPRPEPAPLARVVSA